MPKNPVFGLIRVKNHNSEVTIDTGDDDKDFELANKWNQQQAELDAYDISHLTKKPTTLATIISKYCEEQESTNAWTEKSAQEYRSVYGLLARIVGVLTASNELNFELARQYKETLLKIPPNLNKKPEYRGLSIDDIIALGHKPISTKTVKKHLTRVGSLMAWAKRHGYIEDNVFSGLQIKTNKGKSAANERLPFNQADVDAIFEDSIPIKKEYQRWLPMLGYYTGARINELCQLHLSDIRKEGDIWYLDINDDTDDKRLKNLTSKRRVPIHDALVNSGFMQYVDDLKALEGTERLFPELPPARDGYAKNASRWFSSFKTGAGITHPKKTFHSFRHSFVDYLKAAKVDTHLISALLGHADNSITTGRYGSGEWDLDQLVDAISKLPPHR
jgi:integrase